MGASMVTKLLAYLECEYNDLRAYSECQNSHLIISLFGVCVITCLFTV